MLQLDMALFDPMADFIMSRCEAHRYHGLGGCPQCEQQKKDSDLREATLNELKEQTRLQKEARNEARKRTEAAAHEREHRESVARSEETSRRFEAEYQRQLAEISEEKRARQAREQDVGMLPEQRDYPNPSAAHLDELAQRIKALEQDKDKLGECRCCGQHFIEKYRIFPAPGYRWTGILGKNAELGVCPACYERRIDKGEQVAWAESEWVQYYTNKIDDINDPGQIQELCSILRNEGRHDLAKKAHSRLVSVKIEECIRRIDGYLQTIRAANSMATFAAAVGNITEEYTKISSLAGEKSGYDYGKLNTELQRHQARILAEEEEARRRDAEQKQMVEMRKRQALEQQRQIALEQSMLAAAAEGAALAEHASIKGRNQGDRVLSLIFSWLILGGLGALISEVPGALIGSIIAIIWFRFTASTSR